jgi:hypothetical protein
MVVRREALFVPGEVGDLGGPNWLRRPTAGPGLRIQGWSGRRVPGTAGWRRAALNTERAAELGTQIAEGKKTAPTRPHPHTPPSPAALKTAGPIAPAPELVDAGQGPSARTSWALFIDERPLMLRRRASE